eukprot:CAMPEP_0115275324 /NCGR_PEP_ID=MMETSP0270-20121206/56139_1 /TAXON_ID=71861 /ORGANISM="Scrippsiella trochoidea, Strain CCMP3099" /LENGTH=408 /DNA_ID=CAMNT_0002691877 /DNA_START=109 /DNA_END=1333 /DNA_ORIENTATION=+
MMVLYQILLANRRLFGSVGLAPLTNSATGILKLIGMGSWPIMIIVALAMGTLSRYSSQLRSACTGFCIGWLLATPLYQFVSSQLAYMDLVTSVVEQELVRQSVFFAMTLIFTAITLRVDGPRLFIASRLFGAYLGIAGANKVIYWQEVSESLADANSTLPPKPEHDCFWPSTYFANFASHACGSEIFEWLTLVLFSVITQCAIGWWQRSRFSQQGNGLREGLLNSEKQPSSESSLGTVNSENKKRARAKKVAKRILRRVKRGWRKAVFYTVGEHIPDPEEQRGEMLFSSIRRVKQAAGILDESNVVDSRADPSSERLGSHGEPHGKDVVSFQLEKLNEPPSGVITIPFSAVAAIDRVVLAYLASIKLRVRALLRCLVDAFGGCGWLHVVYSALSLSKCYMHVDLQRPW